MTSMSLPLTGAALCSAERVSSHDVSDSGSNALYASERVFPHVSIDSGLGLLRRRYTSPASSVEEESGEESESTVVAVRPAPQVGRPADDSDIDGEEEEDGYEGHDACTVHRACPAGYQFPPLVHPFPSQHRAHPLSPPSALQAEHASPRLSPPRPSGPALVKVEGRCLPAPVAMPLQAYAAFGRSLGATARVVSSAPRVLSWAQAPPLQDPLQCERTALHMLSEGQQPSAAASASEVQGPAQTIEPLAPFPEGAHFFFDR